MCVCVRERVWGWKVGPSVGRSVHPSVGRLVGGSVGRAGRQVGRYW